MRFYTTESGETAWAPIAVIMTVLVVVMAMGYFFWYVPSQVPAGGVTREVIVNNPVPPPPRPRRPWSSPERREPPAQRATQVPRDKWERPELLASMERTEPRANLARTPRLPALTAQRKSPLNRTKLLKRLPADSSATIGCEGDEIS